MTKAQKKSLAKLVLDSSEPEDVFGPDLKQDDFVAQFRMFATQLHPDHNPGDRDYYTEVITKLLNLRDKAETKLANGTYNKKDAGISVQTKKGKYTIYGKPVEGDICDVYFANNENGPPCALKIAKRPQDRDLLENEQRVLTALLGCDDNVKGKITSHEMGYWPTFVEHSSIKTGNIVRPVNVSEKGQQQCFTLQQVMNSFPDGLDMADAAWMLRRLLEALHWTHKQGYVHGAVLPTNVLIVPECHGLRLIDWCYAVPTKGMVHAVVTGSKDLYAPEIWDKQPATPATDVFMAAKMFQRISKRKMPTSIRSLLNACTLSHPRARIATAKEAYDEISLHLLDAYGKPKFRPFVMPNN